MISDDPADIGRMIRQQGLPAAPVSEEQRSEVRSDCFVKLIDMPERHAAFSLQSIFIQWHFRLTFERSVALHAFLRENEAFIAESCGATMQGVHYRGTYMGIDGARAAYTTLWGYDRWEAQEEWAKLLRDRSSRFYRAVTDLRSFWTSDPNSSQSHFGAAAGIDLLNESFLAITVDAERHGLAYRVPPPGAGAAAR